MSATMTIDLATLSATNTIDATGGSSGYWPYSIIGIVPQWWPTTYYYHACVSYDRGEKAFKLAQALMAKKLVEARTAAQFIALVNTILEVL